MKLRQKLLLDKIIQTNSVNLNELANDFYVSTKTIRNDIDEINDYAKKRNGKLCIAISKETVSFCGDENDKLSIGQQDIDDYYRYKLSAEERVFIIVTRLICTDSYITIDNLANQLFVSRGTINSDIIRIKQWCQENQINISFKKSKGIRLEESEEKTRELLSKLINDPIHIDKRDFEYFEPSDLYQQIFQDIDISTIKEIILTAEEKYNFILSDEAFKELTIQIALSITRDKHHPLSLDEEDGAVSTYQLEYAVAQYIVSQINQQFQIELSQDTVGYFTRHIYGEFSHPVGEYEDTKLPYIQIIAEQLILNVGKILNFNFRYNETFYNRLVNYLSSVIFSIKNRIVMANSLKRKLLKENPSLFEAIQKSSGPLEKFIGRTISDDELSYLLIYFASAMESTCQTIKTRKLAVAVLCNTGHGTAQLVVEKLKQYFNFDIKCVLAAHQLAKTQKSQNFDLIISTVPLKTDLPFVLVSPIIQKADIENINQMVIKLGFVSRVQTLEAGDNEGENSEKFKLIEGVNFLLKEYSACEESQIASRLEDLLNHYKKFQKNAQLKEIVQRMLRDVLKEKYIQLDVEVKDWKAAVEAGGEILYRDGVVAKTYIEAAIQNVMDSGPYIVLTKGVAIPHAGKKYGVFDTAISFIRLKTPVCFGNEENDPVKYVFMLATVDSSSHLVALKDLVSLFELPEFFQVLDRAKTAEDIMDFIKKFEAEKEREL